MDNRVRPGTPKRFAIQIDRAAREFAYLPQEVQGLLRLCDGTRSLRTLRAESGMSPALFERVLGRLVRLGLVGAVSEARIDRRIGREQRAWVNEWSPPQRAIERCGTAITDPMPGAREEIADTMPVPRIDPNAITQPIVLPIGDFSSDEEEFFARSIDHLLEPEERTVA
jgi:hypothetical protein